MPMYCCPTVSQANASELACGPRTARRYIGREMSCQERNSTVSSLRATSRLHGCPKPVLRTRRKRSDALGDLVKNGKIEWLPRREYVYVVAAPAHRARAEKNLSCASWLRCRAGPTDGKTYLLAPPTGKQVLHLRTAGVITIALGFSQP